MYSRLHFSRRWDSFVNDNEQTVVDGSSMITPKQNVIWSWLVKMSLRAVLVGQWIDTRSEEWQRGHVTTQGSIVAIEIFPRHTHCIRCILATYCDTSRTNLRTSIEYKQFVGGPVVFRGLTSEHEQVIVSKSCGARKCANRYISVCGGLMPVTTHRVV